MTNHFTFHCPVTQSAQALSDCEKRHTTMMQGKHRDIEPSICAVAHQCWMCPVRSAFRAGGGIWRKPEDKPRWSEPRDTPAKLPAEIIEHAFGHTLPKEIDYVRAGIGDKMIYNEHLRSLQGKAVGARIESTEQSQSAQKPKGRKKAKTVTQAIDQVETNSYAAAVTETVAKEKTGQNTKPETKPAAKPKSPTRAEAAPKETGKKMSLAERAKLMKEKKAQQ